MRRRRPGDAAFGEFVEASQSTPWKGMENRWRTIRSWFLIAATPMATSMFSKASRLFSTVEMTDRTARFTTLWSSLYGLEGLVRDNRVEVRVFFGAWRKS